mgnify:CR=1 FL=1
MKTLDEPTVENGTPRLAYGLLTDLYQLTMAQGYWENGKLDEQACFTVFFRDAPFKGGFAIACGMSQLAEMIDGFEFTESDIEYLAGLNAPGGGKLFKAEFLEYLQTLKLSVDIDAVREGEVIFPMEPIVRVMGPILECQLLVTVARIQMLGAVFGIQIGAALRKRLLRNLACAVRKAQAVRCGRVALRLSADALRLPTCLRASSMTFLFQARIPILGSCRSIANLKLSARMRNASPRTAFCSSIRIT